MQRSLDAAGQVIYRHPKVPGQQVAGSQRQQSHRRTLVGQRPRHLPDGAVPAGGQYDVGPRRQRVLRLAVAGGVHCRLENQRRFPPGHFACGRECSFRFRGLGLDGVDHHRHPLACRCNRTGDPAGSRLPAMPPRGHLPGGDRGDDGGGHNEQEYGDFGGHGGFRIAAGQGAGPRCGFRYS